MKATRSSMSSETKKIVAKAKRDIDAGRNYKDVLAEVKAQITDSIQYEKASKSIIEYL